MSNETIHPLNFLLTTCCSDWLLSLAFPLLIIVLVESKGCFEDVELVLLFGASPLPKTCVFCVSTVFCVSPKTSVLSPEPAFAELGQ